MHTLQICGATYQVPASWNELSGKKLLAVVATLYGQPPWPRRLQLLSDITGCPVPVLVTLSDVQLVVLLQLTDFLADETQHLTAQLLPVLRVRTQRRGQPLPTVATFHGPAESLRNLSFGEFMFADTFFVLYARRQDAGALDQLVATLYRPRRTGPGANPERDDWCGDYRVPFNENLVDRRAAQLRALPDVEKLAVLTWYRGCRAQLEQRFPEVFEAAEGNASADQLPDWGRTLRNLAGGAFGPLKETAAEHALTVLAEMNDQIAEYRRMKAQAKQPA